jgi:pimeloyl-ACP methyl ester carboxylesterase
MNMNALREAAAFALLMLPMTLPAQFSASPEGGVPTKTTFVRLTNQANAIVVEPETPVPSKGRIAILVTHPENINNFNYFIGRALPQYGYRVMMMNYYGPEISYYEYLAPLSAAVRHLRSLPGVEKVVLAGHSTGGPALTAFQDVAENGAKACQDPVRIYKCDAKLAENLAKADGVMLLDANAGRPEGTLGLNPAVDPHQPRKYNEALDLFSPKNGYDPATGTAKYSPEFLKQFFAAQAARANQLIDEAQARLAKIEKGEGNFKGDEPLVLGGSGLFSGGSRPELAYIGLLSRTHAPHLLLKADGTRSVQIIPVVKQPTTRRADYGPFDQQPYVGTVRQYLATYGLRLDPDYRWTEDNIYGVQWRSTAASIGGNLMGIRVPTLVMTATCAPHTVFHEIAYEHSPAADKEFVGVEGANHGFTPCRPEYGDTFKRAFDYVDGWLGKPGRF